MRITLKEIYELEKSEVTSRQKTMVSRFAEKEIDGYIKVVKLKKKKVGVFSCLYESVRLMLVETRRQVCLDPQRC
jgi:hypothetical protein